MFTALSSKLQGARWSNLSVSRKRMLRIVLLGSLGVHVLAMLIFGGIVMVQRLTQERTVFEVPPPARTYEPRKVELKVKVQKRQRSSSRPAVVPRMVSTRPSEIALPEIKMDPKLVRTTFQPKFKAVTGMGLGAGLGNGYGTSGFGEGVSSVNFFGIQAKGERIAICVDVSVSMIEPERGGPAGYLQVKDRVKDVIESLREGTLFTVIVFADACSVLDPKMQYANGETRQKAKRFLEPYNTEGNYGLDSGNFQGGSTGVKAIGGTTRLDLALTAAMQVGADTILIISDGLPMVKKGVTAAQMQAHAAEVAAWQQNNAGAIAAFAQAQAVAAAAPVQVQRVWVPPTPARPPSKAPLREGAKPDPGAPAQPGHWSEVRVGGYGGHGGGVARPQAPPMPEPSYWKLPDFVEHISLLYEAVYKPKGLKPPQISCIGYQIDKDGGAFLRQLSDQYKGQYRLVRKLK
jgi:hypothetical protein